MCSDDDVRTDILITIEYSNGRQLNENLFWAKGAKFLSGVKSGLDNYEKTKKKYAQERLENDSMDTDDQNDIDKGERKTALQTILDSLPGVVLHIFEDKASICPSLLFHILYADSAFAGSCRNLELSLRMLSSKVITKKKKNGGFELIGQKYTNLRNILPQLKRYTLEFKCG
ncbi:hypothetical protein DL96DRAFT_1015073 [Flagelloscypha sp. PMI_526]|nr:hypothetical protein DL96DRAFT_1015073 [Flagelloscypha sp. PMI_526]